MRLDLLLAERGLVSSREKAKRLVMAGDVLVDGERVDKPGAEVPVEAELELVARPPFVSRGGEKLAFALDHFDLDPSGRVCLDVGASTGGFTDCLLQRGASRVYAVDVGYGQLDYGLRRDERVVVMERINARYLQPDDVGELCDLVTVDVAFISLVKVVPALVPCVGPGGRLLPLVKPQFEAGPELVGKGGIVRDEAVRRRVIEERVTDLEALGLRCEGVADSAVEGAGGNREAFALFRRA